VKKAQVAGCSGKDNAFIGYRRKVEVISVSINRRPINTSKCIFLGQWLSWPFLSQEIVMTSQVKLPDTLP
jgi:hypothetical protein